jgi:hypothetical protein
MSDDTAAVVTFLEDCKTAAVEVVVRGRNVHLRCLNGGVPPHDLAVRAEALKVALIRYVRQQRQAKTPPEPGEREEVPPGEPPPDVDDLTGGSEPPAGSTTRPRESAKSASASGDGRRPPLRFYTAADPEVMGSGEDETIPWEAKGFAAQGAVAEWAGKIKIAGKTTLVLALVKAKLDGTPFLGQPTRQGPVVILTEQSRVTFRVALRRAGLLGRQDLVILYWRDTLGWSWPEIVRAAVDKCKACQATLLVVDTLGQFTGIVGDQENAAGRGLEDMKPLQVAAADGLAVVVNRHERKSGGVVGEAARGSTAYGGVADILLSLRLPEGNHLKRPTLREIHGLSRFDETPSRLLIEWLGGATYRVHDEGAQADVERQETQRALLKVLPRTEDQAATGSDLIKATSIKLTRTVVYEVLEALVQARQVARKGAGKRGDPYRFWWPPNSSADSSATQDAPDETADETFDASPDSSTTPAGVPDESIPPHQTTPPADSSTTSNPRDSMFRTNRDAPAGQGGGGDGDVLRAQVFTLGAKVGFRRHEYAAGHTIPAGEAAWRTFASRAAPGDLRLAIRTLQAQ